MASAGGRITAGVGSNLIGQHAADRNQEATCYVGNLDEQVTEELLWELMMQAGPVASVYVPKDRVTTKHRGHAFVEYKGEDDADYAIMVLNMVKLFGKPIRVNKASHDKKTLDVGANLFVGNLDPDVDEKSLFDTFSAFGVIVNTPKVMRDPDTGISKGFGFVSFDNFEASDAAIEGLHGQFLQNRAISVQYAFKKESNERHGTPAERLMAENYRRLAAASSRPNTLFATAPSQTPTSGLPPQAGAVPAPPPEPPAPPPSASMAPPAPPMAHHMPHMMSQGLVMQLPPAPQLGYGAPGWPQMPMQAAAPPPWAMPAYGAPPPAMAPPPWMAQRPPPAMPPLPAAPLPAAPAAMPPPPAALPAPPPAAAAPRPAMPPPPAAMPPPSALMTPPPAVASALPRPPAPMPPPPAASGALPATMPPPPASMPPPPSLMPPPQAASSPTPPAGMPPSPTPPGAMPPPPAAPVPSPPPAPLPPPPTAPLPAPPTVAGQPGGAPPAPPPPQSV